MSLHHPDRLRAEFKKATEKIASQPYHWLHWYERGDFFGAASYHDLAAGDYYKSLLLLDDALDSSGEYHIQALRPILNPGEESELNDDEVSESTAERIKEHATECCARLTECLLALDCTYDAHQFCTRGLGLNSGHVRLLELRERIGSDEHSKKQSLARREIYAWNDHEPDRYSEDSLQSLNDRVGQVAPQFVVRAVELPFLTPDGREDVSTDGKPRVVEQLGLFAREDIAPGQDVLAEKSLLAVNNRLYDELCDACSAELSTDPAQSFACDDCQTAIFCSQDCLDLAISSYHPAVCDNDDFEAINKDVDIREATDALYGLLLGRAIAMSETQDLHPLDLVETRFLWGDYHVPDDMADSSRYDDPDFQHPRTLPWSFEYNIAGPIHLMTTMDLDIFASIDKYDFWILNTLFAKFRGVANARMNPRTGKPEVAAVHPLWCLANHSCAPNVTWEWGGKIRMWARDGSKGETIRWGEEADVDDKWRGGVAAGQEILNHYCDVQLPVKERREWAAGALGGICMCERCQWESEHP